MSTQVEFVQGLCNVVLQNAGQAMTTAVNEITEIHDDTSAQQVASQHFNYSLYASMLTNIQQKIGDDETLLTIIATAKSKLDEMVHNVDKVVEKHSWRKLYEQSAIFKLNMEANLREELFDKTYAHAKQYTSSLAEANQRCTEDAALVADVAAYTADAVVNEGR